MNDMANTNAYVVLLYIQLTVIVILLVVLIWFLWYACPSDGRIVIKVSNQYITVPVMIQRSDLIPVFVQFLVLRVTGVGAVIIDAII